MSSSKYLEGCTVTKKVEEYKYKFQLRWFSHVPRMPQARLERRVALVTPMGKWPRGRPRTRGCGYISDLAWSRLSVEPAEQGVEETQEVFRVVLGLLHPLPSPGEERV